MRNRALVVIDLQNDITKNYREIIEKVNEAIDWAVQKKLWVAYIKDKIYRIFGYQNTTTAISWPRRPGIPPCCSSTTARASGWASPMATRCIITSTTCRGMSLPSPGPPRGRSWLSTATTPGASAPLPTPPATPWAIRIPSAIGTITTIPKWDSIMYPAVITILRLVGGYNVQSTNTDKYPDRERHAESESKSSGSKRSSNAQTDGLWTWSFKRTNNRTWMQG